MKSVDRQHLEYIVRYCNDISETIERFGDDYDTFTVDQDFYKSISMSLLQIGEHAKSLSEDVLTATKDRIPWRNIKGMRDRFAHGYGEMSSKMIWETATKDTAVLRDALIAFLSLENLP